MSFFRVFGGLYQCCSGVGWILLGSAAGRASGELEGSMIPINFGIMFLNPFDPNHSVVVSEFGYEECFGSCVVLDG
jgi:hypothetical protein